MLHHVVRPFRLFAIVLFLVSTPQVAGAQQVANGASLLAPLQRLQPTSGTLSYVVIVNGQVIEAQKPSLPLAVGSTFKLALLNALHDRIAAKALSWDHVVHLDPAQKSLPSGELQDWPNGTPLTIGTLTAFMLSDSDNTAADTIAYLVGPDAVKPYVAGNNPLLTTREVFTLKARQNASLRERYGKASTAAARRALVDQVDRLPLPTVDQLSKKPDLTVEYHYSVTQLCDLMTRAGDDQYLSINSGPADASDFKTVAYKAGADVGVLNLTTLVTTKRDNRICFSATVNNAKADFPKDPIGEKYGDVLSVLSKM